VGEVEVPVWADALAPGPAIPAEAEPDGGTACAISGPASAAISTLEFNEADGLEPVLPQ